MKKEMLRINNLNMEYSTTERLRNITLCLLAGECVGFLGLENSGKRLLEDFICGKLNVDRVSFYFDGVRRINTEDLCRYVYKIIASNFLIDDWTVAEYIFLVDESSFLGINKKRLAAKTEELFLEFGLEINPDRKLKKLTELEKRMVDLLKAYSKHSRIVVIEDEFEGCSTMDIKKFKELIDRVSSRELAVVVNSHSDHVSRILSDKFIIFKKGSIVKKCRKDFIIDNSNLEELLLGGTRTSPEILADADGVEDEKIVNDRKSQKGIQMHLKESQAIIYSIGNMTLKRGCVFHFDFYQGEVTTILSLDLKEKTQLFQLLSGRTIDKTMNIVLEKKRCDFNDIIGFVKNRIASIADMGGESELLLSMSAGNNLLIPSLEKISAVQHVLMERRVLKMLENEIKNNLKVKHENIRDMSVNEYILLLLERWLIYKPKVMILFEPFVHCDIFGVSLVKSYIKKFTEAGSAVIIIKSREEYVEDISDRIIHI
ncbi:hypothetical protein FRZ06_03560 [Anoxybacterium hadale]|uniref:Uncharacterized protein n=1 Tax=Anoxybacterium hadale TaxID=3408580 RepID=A0ACD1A7V5_9FIRM|nr:hypothetical protein FRZ06_03560 [Clostridiales bacterium]